MSPRRVLALLAVVAAGAAGCSGSSSTPAQSSAASASTVSHHHHSKPAPKCPLTGVTAHKGQDVKRAPLAVKIDNVGEALPQAGVNGADVVFEELVEGGLTRLMAVFQCNTESTVGPIRSARISDADLLALLHGSVLGFSGANPADLPPIEAHGDAALISDDATPQFFHRDLDRAAPHNVFSSTTTLLKAGEARKPHLHAPKPLFGYGPLPRHAKAARHISLTWPASNAAWSFAAGQGYLRTQNGVPDKLVNGKTISASNVVVLSVDIASTGLHDVLGSASPLDVTIGSRPVWVFRNGHELTGIWKRKGVTSGLRLQTRHGKVIRLAPGRTWVELLPSGSTPHLG